MAKQVALRRAQEQDSLITQQLENQQQLDSAYNTCSSSESKRKSFYEFYTQILRKKIFDRMIIKLYKPNNNKFDELFVLLR